MADIKSERPEGLLLQISQYIFLRWPAYEITRTDLAARNIINNFGQLKMRVA
jgi:hypothetical protein